MTTDSTQPQNELGPASANGQGQSQGHRRRRRRRKNKNSQPSAPQGQQGQGQPSQAQPPAPVQAQPVGQAQPPQPRQANQNSGQGQGRKKKKFFQKGSGGSQQQPGNNGTTHQPGNTQGGSQGKRKGGKQRGPREFVGPMDHSYRVANGNVADGPPSTIQISSSNGHGHSGGYYQENYAPPAAAIREDAPTRIFCFIEDLFFQAKIIETSRKLGV